LNFFGPERVLHLEIILDVSGEGGGGEEDLGTFVGASGDTLPVLDVPELDLDAVPTFVAASFALHWLAEINGS
jgi:hypothetical protein